jgi:copper(I)-binding protein
MRRLVYAVALSALASSAIAAPPTAREPWIRATPPGVPTAAAYLVLEGHGTADRLIDARSTAAERVEIHTHVHENGLMVMKRVDALAVPATGTAVLEPGADHVMLIGLHETLLPGTTVTITLVFERSGATDVAFPVLDARAAPPTTPAPAAQPGHRH